MALYVLKDLEKNPLIFVQGAPLGWLISPLLFSFVIFHSRTTVAVIKTH